jgi:endonuclease YncB( thermonuclease family)
MIVSHCRLSTRAFWSVVLIAAAFAGPLHAQGTAAPRDLVIQAYQELFAQSQKEKRGLMFYVKGQQIGGAVTRVIGNDAVEVRNQTHSRIIIRIDQIDAVAIN